MTVWPYYFKLRNLVQPSGAPHGIAYHFQSEVHVETSRRPSRYFPEVRRWEQVAELLIFSVADARRCPPGSSFRIFPRVRVVLFGTR